jgi:transcriptional regulator with XRE-family HTH domain
MQQKDYTDLQEKFGAYVQKIREHKGLSLRNVASNCELDSSNISKIERGFFNVRLSTIVELAKGLEIHPKKLLDFELE